MTGEPLADPVAFEVARELRGAVPELVRAARWRRFLSALRGLYTGDGEPDAAELCEAEATAAALAMFATAYRNAASGDAAPPVSPVPRG